MTPRWILLACIAIIGFAEPASAAGFKFPKGVKVDEFRPHPQAGGIRALNENADKTAKAIVFESISADYLVKLEPFSQDRIAEAIKELASQLALKQAEKNPAWTFDPGTGNLTTRASIKVGGGEIKFGKTNLYVIAVGIAATIAACEAFEQLDARIQCVKKELQKELQQYGRRPSEGMPAGGMTVEE